MAFNNCLVVNLAITRSVPPFFIEGNIASEASRVPPFYRPLASIMKTCGNEDVPLKVPPGN